MVAEEKKQELMTCHICKREYQRNKLLFVEDMAICPTCQSIDGYERSVMRKVRKMLSRKRMKCQLVVVHQPSVNAAVVGTLLLIKMNIL
jgi:hypothetical protein